MTLFREQRGLLTKKGSQSRRRFFSPIRFGGDQTFTNWVWDQSRSGAKKQSPFLTCHRDLHQKLVGAGFKQNLHLVLISRHLAFAAALLTQPMDTVFHEPVLFPVAADTGAERDPAGRRVER